MKVTRGEDEYVHWIEHNLSYMDRVFSRLPGLLIANKSKSLSILEIIGFLTTRIV